MLPPSVALGRFTWWNIVCSHSSMGLRTLCLLICHESQRGVVHTSRKERDRPLDEALPNPRPGAHCSGRSQLLRRKVESLRSHVLAKEKCRAVDNDS